MTQVTSIRSGTTTSDGLSASQDSLAVSIIGTVLDSPPALANDVLRDGARITQRWGHGAFEAVLPAMQTHVIMTYYGASQNSSRRVGAHRLSGRTRPGTVTVIPEGHEGMCQVEGPIEVSHVYITDERLQSASETYAKGRKIELVDRVCFEDPTCARVLELLSNEAAQPDASSMLFAEQALDLLCAQLARGHSTATVTQEPLVRKGLADWQVKRVTSYMRDFLDQEIRLDDLAALLKLSRFHFCTAFRLATGQTPHEWLTAVRISKAKQMLMSPDVPVTTIALAVGYQTPSSFASSFRKICGLTPSEFRRAL